MFNQSNFIPEICVIGRTDFSQTGMGTLSYSVCEMLARNYPVSFFPNGGLSDKIGSTITLPNGRIIPICQALDRIKVFFFADLVCYHPHDFNYLILDNKNSLKIASLVFDSTKLPHYLVEILNTKFHAVVVTSPHLVDVARNSGVQIPIAVVPIALDLDSLLAQPFHKPNKSKIKFGSVASFHRRKGIHTLIESFTEAFSGQDNVELVLHSNLNFSQYVETLSEKLLKEGCQNITLSCKSLSLQEKNSLINSFDVFVNCSQAEGYSVGPREALALGKSVVLSGVGGHNDLAGSPGIFIVPAEIAVPGRYPELSNRVFGEQSKVDVNDFALALREAYQFVLSKNYEKTYLLRKQKAADFSFNKLSISYSEIINPQIRAFKKLASEPALVNIPPSFKKVINQHLGYRALNLKHLRKSVIQAHDGGFFSIFNVFLSHLVWNLREDDCAMVLPDMDVARLINRYDKYKIQSFCYGKIEDGNIWTKFFEPLYDLSEAELNNFDFLYENACVTEDIYNAEREPYLTYKNAFKLYNSVDFASIRKQYHQVYKNYIHLKPSLAQEIESFVSYYFKNKYMIAAHIRHLSHTVEQPDAVIAQEEDYIQEILNILNNKGIEVNSSDWGLFLATDQEQTVEHFQNRFPNHIFAYDDVRRITQQEDSSFRSLSEEEKNQDGYQLQHLVAATTDNWSTRMAWEVIRDAVTMSKCHVLLHVVSNVSTAVSYMNPDIELKFCFKQ